MFSKLTGAALFNPSLEFKNIAFPEAIEACQPNIDWELHGGYLSPPMGGGPIIHNATRSFSSNVSDIPSSCTSAL